jgi:hypothetical protein
MRSFTSFYFPFSRKKKKLGGKNGKIKKTKDPPKKKEIKPKGRKLPSQDHLISGMGSSRGKEVNVAGWGCCCKLSSCRNLRRREKKTKE